MKLTILEEVLNTLEIHGKERAIIAKQLQKLIAGINKTTPFTNSDGTPWNIDIE